jgi:hypothetical protein
MHGRCNDVHSSPRSGDSTETLSVSSSTVPPAGRPLWNICYRCFSAQNCWPSSCFRLSRRLRASYHSCVSSTPPRYLNKLREGSHNIQHTSPLTGRLSYDSSHEDVNLHHDRYLLRYRRRHIAGVCHSPQKVQRTQDQWHHQARQRYKIPSCVCYTCPAANILSEPRLRDFAQFCWFPESHGSSLEYARRYQHAYTTNTPQSSPTSD